MEELKQRVCDVVSYKKNIALVQAKIEVLTEMVAQIQSLLISGENEGTDDVQQWLAEAYEILIRAIDILEGSNNIAHKKRLCSSCWYPSSSWETGDILRGIYRILKRRDGLDLSFLIFGPTYCKNLQSRESMLEEILEALMDIHVNMIGIYGMFGVGKSVLAKELARRAQNDQFFDAIVMVQVSESLDVKFIQTQIANEIGLQLSDDDDEETRGHILYYELEKKVMESGQENNIEPIQQSKILVILDGVQCAIDLRKVGISHEQEGRTSCKAVLISRNTDICKEMGAEKNFLVDCLNFNEAKILFLERLGDNMETTDDMLERENVMLVKCGGLPLMINSLAGSLRSMSLSNREILADEMEMHTLLEVDEVKEVPCAILELCNNFLQTGGKQKLFLLCCLLIQQGGDVPLEKLMRYGIGFGLFEDGSSDSIVKQINSWVHELKSISLLMESEKPQHVKMHDLIQDVVISALSQGDYSLPVMLEAGTGWHTRESYENCVALSMMAADSNFRCLNGLDLPKLEAFMSNGDEPSLSLPDKYFQGMQNLKILDISGRPFLLPSSIGDLKNLVTLHLENCELQGGLTSMCNLSGLEVLSLRGSTFVTNLPDEIGNLTNLRVLDLTACLFHSTFPLDVVAKLKQLRELYLYQIVRKWRIDDLKKMAALPLEVFEIVIELPGLLSLDALNFPNLRRFRILYGDHVRMDDEEFNSYSSSLLIEKCARYQFKQSGLQDLPQRTECLHIKCVSGLGKGIGDLNVMHVGGFPQLKNLSLDGCVGMECILDTSYRSCIIDQQAVEIFPELQVLTLRDLFDLTSLLCCPKPCYYSFFPKLRELRLQGLSQLHPYVLPVQLSAKLRVMEVTYCESLLYIFSGASEIINESGHGADKSTVELPYMEKLKLNGLNSLLALEDSSKASIIGDEHQILFDDKINLPALQGLYLSSLGNIQKLWKLYAGDPASVNATFSKLQYIYLEKMPGLTDVWNNQLCPESLSFRRLKNIEIIECEHLKSLCPPTVASALVQLESLKITSCHSLKEVVKTETNANNVVNFPSLRMLKLDRSSSLQCFIQGSYTIEFPSLKTLILSTLPVMSTFIKSPENSGSPTNAGAQEGRSPVTNQMPFIKEIKFPSLERLEICDVGHTEKLVEGGHDAFPKLKSLIIENTCFEFIPEIVLGILERLELRNCGSVIQRLPWTSLPILRSLVIHGGPGMTSMLSSTDIVQRKGMLLLEDINIEECEDLKEIVSKECENAALLRHGASMFPRLKHIKLGNLKNFITFTSGRYETNFEVLEKVEVHTCPRFKWFSLGELRTPELEYVQVDDEASTQGVIDLNDFIHNAFERRGGAMEQHGMPVDRNPGPSQSVPFVDESLQSLAPHEPPGQVNTSERNKNTEPTMGQQVKNGDKETIIDAAKDEAAKDIVRSPIAIDHKQTNVPKFSSRAAEDPKQPKFQNPRKTRTDPIEPQMNRNLGPAQASKPNPPLVVKPREGGQFKKAEDAVTRPDNASLRTNDSHQRHGGRGLNSADSHAKPHAVRSAGASVEQSPIHPRTGGRGSSSQPSSSDNLQGASGRPRTRPTSRQSSNQPVGGPTVPEFGAWNKNPEQAEGYTDVFNQVLTDKKTPGRNPSSSTPHNPLHTPKKTEGNCFSRLFRCFSSEG